MHDQPKQLENAAIVWIILRIIFFSFLILTLTDIHGNKDYELPSTDFVNAKYFFYKLNGYVL